MSYAFTTLAESVPVFVDLSGTMKDSVVRLVDVRGPINTPFTGLNYGLYSGLLVYGFLVDFWLLHPVVRMLLLMDLA